MRGSQMKRGSLLSQPQAILQKLASISDGNPLAPRNSRGFLFQTLSPEKDGSASGVPQKQVHECCIFCLGGRMRPLKKDLRGCYGINLK